MCLVRTSLVDHGDSFGPPRPSKVSTERRVNPLPEVVATSGETESPTAFETCGKACRRPDVPYDGRPPRHV